MNREPWLQLICPLVWCPRDVFLREGAKNPEFLRGKHFLYRTERELFWKFGGWGGKTSRWVLGKHSYKVETSDINFPESVHTHPRHGEFVENPKGHTYTSWRNTDPSSTPDHFVNEVEAQRNEMVCSTFKQWIWGMSGTWIKVPGLIPLCFLFCAEWETLSRCQ